MSEQGTDQILDNHKGLSRYGSNIAGPFWFLGNTAMAAAVGLGGTWNETAAGVFNLAATLLPTFAGQTRFGMPALVMSSIVGVAIMQGPHLLAGEPLSWAGYAALILSSAPVLLEPWTQSWAKVKRETLSAAKSSVKRLQSVALSYLANSRAGYSLGGSACLLALAGNDALHGRFQLFPAYGLLLTGNFFNGFAEAKPRPVEKAKIISKGLEC